MNETINKIKVGAAYYCKKRKIPTFKKILNRVMFWRPKIDYIVTDIRPSYFVIDSSNLVDLDLNKIKSINLTSPKDEKHD